MDSDGAVVFIDGKEFKKRMLGLIKSDTELGAVYAGKMIEEEGKDNPNEKYLTWLRKQADGLAIDIRHNYVMLQRIKIEEGHLLFWLDLENNLKMRRCSKEEYDYIYGRKKLSYIT